MLEQGTANSKKELEELKQKHANQGDHMMEQARTSEEAMKGLAERLNAIEGGCLALIGTLGKKKPPLDNSRLMKAIAESKEILEDFTTSKIEMSNKKQEEEKRELQLMIEQTIKKVRDSEKA